MVRKKRLRTRVNEVLSGIRVGIKVVILLLPVLIAYMISEFLSTTILSSVDGVNTIIFLNMSFVSIIGLIIGFVFSGTLFIRYKQWLYSKRWT